MLSRAKDWLNQAKRDLLHAKDCLKSGFFEWGCFSAQQAAEKAVKAVFLNQHAEAWGNSVKKLVEQLPKELRCPPDLIESGAVLDKFYIPTRYPNGFDEGIPGDYYTQNDLLQAIQNAEKIIRFCENSVL